MTYGYAGFFGSRVNKRTCALDYRDRKPVPPLVEYEAYRDSLDARCQHKFDCQKYRRIAVLRRAGSSFGEAVRLVGGGPNKQAYDKIPEHLK